MFSPKALILLLCTFPLAVLAADVPGVGNFHQVNDHVYRGAQPTPEGFRNLAHLGIATIVDLREPGHRSDAEKQAVEAAGMHYVTVPLKGLGAPAAEDVAKILALLDDTATGPVFVHCRRGADRTGTILACYRIEHDHWQNQKALAEAKTFGMSWIERAMQSYVLGYTPPKPAPAAAVATNSQ